MKDQITINTVKHNHRCDECVVMRQCDAQFILLVVTFLFGMVLKEGIHEDTFGLKMIGTVGGIMVRGSVLIGFILLVKTALGY